MERNQKTLNSRSREFQNPAPKRRRQPTNCLRDRVRDQFQNPVPERPHFAGDVQGTSPRMSACGKDLPRPGIVPAVDGRLRRDADLSARLGIPLYLLPGAEGGTGTQGLKAAFCCSFSGVEEGAEKAAIVDRLHRVYRASGVQCWLRKAHLRA